MKFTNETKLFLGIIIFSLLMVVGAVYYLSQPAPVIDKKSLVSETSHSFGNTSASNYLVEFSDLQCPACKSFYPVVKQLTEKNKDKLVFYYRHFPLEQHKQSTQAALSAEAAYNQGKYYEMIDNIFSKNQDEFSEDLFRKSAEEIGLNLEIYDKDIKDATISSRIENDRNQAIILGVNSTPTFYLNGKKLDLMTIDDLTKIVESEINK